MPILDRIGPTAITNANVALGSAVPAGQAFKIATLLIQQPAGSVSKTIKVAIGTTATAANVVRTILLAAGLVNYTEAPGLVVKAGEQINVICDLGTTEAVIEFNGARDIVT